MSVGAVQINAVAVHLPNLDQRIANRLTARIENPSAEVRDLAERRREAVVHYDEVIVSIQRQVVGIERPFGLARRAHEFVGEGARDGEKGGSEAHAAEKASAILQEGWLIHVHN